MKSFKEILTENEFLKTIKNKEEYIVIEVLDKNGNYQRTPVKIVPIKKLIDSKEKWLEWANKNYGKITKLRAYIKNKNVFTWDIWEGWKVN